MMSKLVYFARRHPSLTEKEFSQRWLKHFRLGQCMPSWDTVARYAQCQVLTDLPPELPAGPRYDGVGIIWFRSSSALPGADPGSARCLRQDELETFERPVAQGALVTDERLLKDAKPGSIKVFSSLAFSGSSTPTHLHEELQTIYMEILSSPSLQQLVARASINLAQDTAYSAGTLLRYAGVAELSFESIGAALQFYASERYGAICRHSSVEIDAMRVVTREQVLYEREHGVRGTAYGEQT